MSPCYYGMICPRMDISSPLNLHYLTAITLVSKDSQGPWHWPEYTQDYQKDWKGYYLDAFICFIHIFIELQMTGSFLYARLKNRTYYAMAMSVRLSVHPSVRPSVRLSFPDFFSMCFEISIWNLVYAFSRWHDMSSLSFITIGSLWPSLQPKIGQTQFLQSWPYKSR